MKNEIIINYYNTPYGELILGSFDEQLCLCDWRYRKMRNTIDDRLKKQRNASFIDGFSEVLEQTKLQLNEYFQGERTQFDLPLHFVGTDFQINVWNALLQIEYGKTNTYLGLSQLMKNELAIRAVASANGANAIAIIVPCHRIIGSNGDLVGYAGGLPAKKKLLQLENAELSEQLNMF